MVETPLFNKAWQAAKVRIFRLEALQEYDAPEEKVLFEKWKKGDKNFTEYDGWFKLLGQAKEKGIPIHKVKVVKLPVSEHLKYEIDLWKKLKIHGEQILVIEEEKYNTLTQNPDFKPKDFWLFDDKLAIIFDYNEKGELVGEELVTDKTQVAKHLELKNRLTESSLSLTPFLYKVKRG